MGMEMETIQTQTKANLRARVLLIAVLELIVGGIVIAMFLPIFKLNEVVSQNSSGH